MNKLCELTGEEVVELFHKVINDLKTKELVKKARRHDREVSDYVRQAKIRMKNNRK